MIEKTKTQEKRVVMIIQCRMGSVRLPGKSMLDLAGKPLLWRVLERVKRCQRIHTIVLATTQLPEDDVLAEIAWEQGVQVFRGSENDVLDRYYQAAKRFEADIVVRLTADNPVAEPSEVDRIIGYHLRGESDFSSNTHDIQNSGYPDGLGAEVFDFGKLEEVWNLAKEQRNREHPHTYFFDHPEKYKIGTVECPKEFRRPDLIFDVDTQEEYDFISALYEYLYPRNPKFHITEIIEWYDNVWRPQRGDSLKSTMAKQGVRSVVVPWAKPYFSDKEVYLLLETVKSGWWSQGLRVEQLENRVRGMTRSPYCIAVNSGTAALDTALKLFEVAPGDEIIVPAFAYIATVSCVLYQGAKPVFADIDLTTYNISPQDVRRKITPRTKGIIAIDYGGQAAQWDELRSIAQQVNLFLVEDGAPGFGGQYKGRPLCTLGDVGITSFHVAKIFTAIEGGMLFVSNKEFAHRACMIRSHGESLKEKYLHPILGHNYRMSDIHAAFGLVQLSRFEQVLAHRAKAARYYSQNLSSLDGVTLPQVLPENQHAWFLYPIRVRERDTIQQILAKKGIETNISWPQPLYDQPFLLKFKQETCPNAEEACLSILCLPLHYELTQEQQDIVIDALKEAVSSVDRASSGKVVKSVV